MKRNDPRIRALEICLTQMQQGASLEQVLEVYPDWAADLRPLLEAAQAARQFSQSLQPPVSAMARSRSAMLQAARLAAQAPHPRPSVPLPTWMARQATQPRPASLFSSVLRLALTVILLFLFVGGGTTLVASAKSLPGDTLYPLKIGTERVRLFLVRQPKQRLDLETRFDQQRIVELQALQRRSEESGVVPEMLLNFAGMLTASDSKEWQVGHIRVMLDDQTQIIGEIRQGVLVDVQGLLQADDSVMARRIQARQFELTGRLQNISPEGWLVDGLVIAFNELTIYQGQPQVGSQLSISAFVLADGRLLARLVQVLELSSPSSPLQLPAGSTPQRDHSGEAEAENENQTAVPDPEDDEKNNPTPRPDDDDPDKTPKPGDDDDPNATPDPGNDDDPDVTPDPGNDDDPDATPDPANGDDLDPTPEPGDDDQTEQTPGPRDDEGRTSTPLPDNEDEFSPLLNH